MEGRWVCVLHNIFTSTEVKFFRPKSSLKFLFYLLIRLLRPVADYAYYYCCFTRYTPRVVRFGCYNQLQQGHSKKKKKDLTTVGNDRNNKWKQFTYNVPIHGVVAGLAFGVMCLRFLRHVSYPKLKMVATGAQKSQKNVWQTLRTTTVNVAGVLWNCLFVLNFWTGSTFIYRRWCTFVHLYLHIYF